MSAAPSLVLASGSPRRRAMLEALGLRFTVRPAGIDEARRPDEHPVAYAERMAAEKAAAALAVGACAPGGPVVLAADTVVHLGQRVFDKPRDPERAAATLAALSDREHRVTTGTCVRAAERAFVRHVTTRVRFRALSEAEIRRYVDSGEPLDKAGGYGLQGLGGLLVARVEGSTTNVIGLPLAEVLADLAALGVAP